MSPSPDRLPIRPYARLLTMLGEQLIKNDRIALVELVKNAYDADATKVELRFEGFGPELQTTSQSKIIVLDNGTGMSNYVVRQHWLNPATSLKVQQKRLGHPTTKGGRVIQGEKGIGRFAMFKLGSAVTMTTRPEESRFELQVKLDIGFLDGPLGTNNGLTRIESSASGEDLLRDSFLDELTAELSEGEPRVFDGTSTRGGGFLHGTRLEIRNLRSQWSHEALQTLHQDLFRLRPLESLLTGKAGVDPLEFRVSYLVNGIRPTFLSDPEILLNSLLGRAVLRVVGSFKAIASEFSITVNDRDEQVNLNSPDMRQLRLFRERFGKTQEDVSLECGDFAFEFLFFDLRPSAPTKFRLDPDERDLVKDHRIYLYRDDVRVLPYGDPEDDWLQLDVIRGTQGASRVFSNDQTLGFVYITQEANPALRDKTNREGLIDSGRAYGDFVLALQLLITHLRRTEFALYLAESRRVDEAVRRSERSGLQQKLHTLSVASEGNPRLTAAVADFARTYQVEHDFLTQRAERTEDLAGVGLSVETASHDVVATANQALRDIRLLLEDIRAELGQASPIHSRATAIAEALSFIVSRLQDVQGLFVSTRQKPRLLNVMQFARRVETIYRRLLDEAGIDVNYVGDGQLQVKTVEATLLQIFLNLMDNSVYWLQAARTPNPTIQVEVRASDRVVIFSDNGPGVGPEYAPYIFDAFFSSKGDEGRGLGLYIASEVAIRSGYRLRLLPASASPLGGAAFVLELEPA